LVAYHQQTSPVCGYYQKKGIHVALDAARHPQHVYGQIIGVFRNSKDL
jgi:adenylate kinase